MDLSSLATVVGVIALIMSVWALTRKDDTNILLILGTSVLLWAAHYFMMGSVTGGTMHVIASIGIFTADRMKSMPMTPRLTVASIFAGLNVITGTVWWTGLSDLFAVAGGVVLGYSQFCFQGRAMRTGFVLGEAIMFGYAFTIGSFPGMGVTAINLVAGIVGLWRIARSRNCQASMETKYT